MVLRTVSKQLQAVVDHEAMGGQLFNPVAVMQAAAHGAAGGRATSSLWAAAVDLALRWCAPQDVALGRLLILRWACQHDRVAVLDLVVERWLPGALKLVRGLRLRPVFVGGARRGGGRRARAGSVEERLASARWCPAGPGGVRMFDRLHRWTDDAAHLGDDREHDDAEVWVRRALHPLCCCPAGGPAMLWLLRREGAGVLPTAPDCGRWHSSSRRFAFIGMIDVQRMR